MSAEVNNVVALNESSIITAERVRFSIRKKFNALRGLTPDLFVNYLEAFRHGFIANLAVTWDAMERRDYTLSSVIPKRKKSVARLEWEIVQQDESPEARAQRDVLDYFYRNLTATSALEPDEQGGLGLLVRQMMDAVGKRYAVHELVYQPGPRGLTAEFRFCPLWWFESTQGRLRFLPQDFAMYGVDMNRGEWMVTVGDGIMEACALCYMFKNMSLKDWLAFSEKFGTPGIIGKTDATKGSTEWNDFADALANFGQDFALITSLAAQVDLVEVKTAGDGPYKPLVDQMDKAMITLWRGGDLGTKSAQNSVGANIQEDEAGLLEVDDAQWISETLGRGPSRFVLDYAFGPGTPAKAEIKLLPKDSVNKDVELKVDEFLVNAGGPVAVADTLERYGRPLPESGEKLLQKVQIPNPNFRGNTTGEKAQIANSQGPAVQAPIAETLSESALQGLSKAFAASLQPLRERIQAIIDLHDDGPDGPALFATAVKKLQRDLPEMLKGMDANSETARAIEAAIGAATVNGMVEGVVNHG